MKISKASQSQSLNAKNQFLHNFFDQKRRKAQLDNNPKLAFCFKKVMNSIERYPLPILSTKQALELEGVGPKMASMIGVLIKIQYKNYLATDQLNEISTTDNTREDPSRFESNMASQVLLESENEQEEVNRSQSFNRISQSSDNQQGDYNESLFQAPSLKRARSLQNDDDELDYKKTLKKYSNNGSNVTSNASTASRARIRDYKPEKNSSSANILLGLYSHQSQTGTNFASKKEIKHAIGQLSKVIPGIDVNNWSTLCTLLKHEYITVFNSINEEKFALTDYGLKYAGSIYELRVAEAESLEKVPKTLASITHLVAPAEDSDDSRSSKTRFTLFDEMRESQKAPAGPSGFTLEYQKLSVEFSRELMSKKRLSVIEEETTIKKEVDYIEIDDQTLSIQVYEPSKSKKPPKNTTIVEDDDHEISFIDENSNTINTKSQLISQDVDSRSIRPFDSDEGLDETTKTVDENNTMELAEPEFRHQVLKREIKSYKIELYVDNREIKNKKDRSYIYDQLVQNGISVQLKNLPIGDFLWVVVIDTEEEKTVYPLDHIIERKTADDLASSIFDGRYNHQKYRLKASQLKHLYYLCEGKTTKNSMLSQQNVDSAMTTTRLVDKLKTHHSKDIEESINWITKLNMVVEKNFSETLQSENLDFLEFRSTYEEFCKKNTKAPSDPRAIFSQMLRQIHGCGRETVATITSQYSCVKDLFYGLNRLPSDSARRVVLKGLSSRLNKTTLDNIVMLFCKEEYPKIEKEDVLQD